MSSNDDQEKLEPWAEDKTSSEFGPRTFNSEKNHRNTKQTILHQTSKANSSNFSDPEKMSPNRNAADGRGELQENGNRLRANYVIANKNCV